MDRGIGATLRHLRTLAAVRSALALDDGELLGRFVVLGKIEGLPKHLSWHDNGPEGAFTDEEWQAAHAAEPILKHIAEQTGLTIREETRPVRVLTVERR